MKMQNRNPLLCRLLLFFFMFASLVQVSCAVSSKNQSPTESVLLEINSSTADFIEHTQNKPFQSWLGMNLHYAGFEKARKQVEATLSKQNSNDTSSSAASAANPVSPVSLINRGEAHITVISPVEYDKVLSEKISIQKIHELAVKNKIQEAKWKALCIGRGQKELDAKLESTYYVVVASEDLVNFRKLIQSEFEKAGGQKDKFQAELFYPHVTLGFTKRDLHFEDGIIKNENSCWMKIQTQ